MWARSFTDNTFCTCLTSLLISCFYFLSAQNERQKKPWLRGPSDNQGFFSYTGDFSGKRPRRAAVLYDALLPNKRLWDQATCTRRQLYQGHNQRWAWRYVWVLNHIATKQKTTTKTLRMGIKWQIKICATCSYMHWFLFSDRWLGGQCNF